MDIIFATKNKNKLKEVNKIFEETKFNIISLEEAGIKINIEEDGKTFEENSMKKAKIISKYCNETVLADDSGLEIDYLDKKPGVHSARFLGENTSYEIKNKHIIDLLKDVPFEKRTARFIVVITAVLKNGNIFTTKGVMEGFVNNSIDGTNGFGYDPIFYLPTLKKTLSSLTIDEKNKISHRGIALLKMKEYLI